jgi:integrase/recombinase XerC
MALPAADPGLPADAEAFLAEVGRVRRLSLHTLAAYRADLAELVESAASTNLSALVPADIRRALARQHARGMAPATLARRLSAWRSFFAWLLRQGRLAANPAAGIRPPRRARLLPKALSPDQAVQLAAHEPAVQPGEGESSARDQALAARDKAIVELLYSSGLRLAELVSLDCRYFAAEAGAPASFSWLDLPGKTVVVRGKGSKTRSVPVGAAAAEALHVWLKLRGALAGSGERALFVAARGRRISPRNVQTRLARWAREAGLDMHVHPHVLRHSMASHVLQSSGDLRAVQELLGHASIATTQIYTRLDWQHLARSYDAAHPRARRKPG